MKMFVLQHTHQINEEESVKLLGVYSTRKLAEAAIKGFARLPGFSETPGGFSIDEYEVDRDYWSEGFKVVG